MSNLDLFLLAEERGKRLAIVTCVDGEARQVQSFRQTLVEMFPDLMSQGFDAKTHSCLKEEDLLVDLHSSNTWILLHSNFANGEAAAHEALNHFMPAWHKNTLEETTWNQCCKDAQADEAEIFASLQNLLEACKDEDELASSHWQGELWKAEATFNLLSALREENILAEAVEGDGNCGVWSLIELEIGMQLPGARRPPLNVANQKQKCKQWRAETWHGCQRMEAVVSQ